MTQPTPTAWRQKIGAVVLHPTTQLIILLLPVSKDEIERLHRELAEIKAMLREQSPR